MNRSVVTHQSTAGGAATAPPPDARLAARAASDPAEGEKGSRGRPRFE